MSNELEIFKNAINDEVGSAMLPLWNYMAKKKLLHPETTETYRKLRMQLADAILQRRLPVFINYINKSIEEMSHDSDSAERQSSDPEPPEVGEGD